MACVCGDCTLLQSDVRPFYTPAQAVRSDARPILIGLYTKQDWDDHQPLFIFRCRTCFEVRFSFPCRGDERPDSIPHLHCTHCSDQPHVINDWTVHQMLLGGENPPEQWYHLMHNADDSEQYKLECFRGVR